MLETLKSLANSLKATKKALAYIDGASPHEIIFKKGPMRLRSYQPKDVKTQPIVLVMPIINRFRLCDLEPEFSLVASLVRDGSPVYVVDWGDPIRLDQDIDWHTYVLDVLPRVMKIVGPERSITLMGICLGGTIASVYAALFPKQIRQLITLNTPIDFSHMKDMVEWVKEDYFPVDRLTDALGNMPGAMIAQGFEGLRPLAALAKWRKAFPRFEDAQYADTFHVIESWNKDNVDVPGAAYRTLIKDLYRQNKLVKGEFQLRGRVVNLQNIDAQTLAIGASSDTICHPLAAKALVDSVSSETKEYFEVRGGHIASIIGPRAAQNVYPKIKEWIAQ